MRSKLDPRGRTGIFVGYADDHAGNVYRFINTQTKKIILSRDVQWLNSFWKEYKKRKDDSRKLVDVFYSLKEDSQDKSDKEETYGDLLNTDMSKIKCFNCGEMGHFARNCPKPRENANLARENERNNNFGNWMDLGDNSVCEECAMICTDVYSTDESKGMKSVVLSTTEAEYMALSEVVKELKFIVQLLQTMNITVELPITVHVDNVGAIWLSNNRNTGDRTKHIDIRTAFVKEYQEDGKIIIKFVKSEENDADIFTKNTSSTIYQKHQEKLVWDKKEVINVLKNPYSRFGLISSCADQFNSWCSPMLRFLFTCIFHNL